MQINIKTKDIDLTPSLQEYIERKIGELDKFVQNVGDAPDNDNEREPVQAFVEVGRTTQHHRKGDVYRAEVQITLPHAEGVRAVAEEWDIHRAIDEVKDEMQRNLRRYKEKRRTKFFIGRRAFKRVSKISPLARFRRERGGEG